jgi:lysophospholipase L1-like esterase
MKRLLAFTALLALVACSDDDTKTTATTNPDAGGGNTAVDQSAVGAGSKFATYVILGDSISDKGGTGPFFYDLLGTDLQGKLGDVTIQKNSKGGAVSKGLLGQVQALPATLKGPVGVTVTIGGNDMQAAAINILSGKDDADRAAFKANLKAAYDELLKPGRFGEGVGVTVFYASIYDPTDGTGNFAEAKCPQPLGSFPKMPTTTFWDHWNGDYDGVMSAYGANAVKVDIRALFQGHGLATADTWFVADCIHPNTAGHAALDKKFFSVMEP